MLIDATANHFPLPKNWPRNVKPAVIHVISLAHVAIIHTRGLLLNSCAGPAILDGCFMRFAGRFASLQPAQCAHV